MYIFIIAEDSVTATFSESTRELPSWVVSAASDVDRLTVQQQFQPAVQIILNIRKYRQGVDANFQKLLTKSQPKKSLPEAAAQQEARDKQYRTFVVLKALCKAVEDRAQSLTNAIAVTLPNLSKSQVLNKIYFKYNA